MADDERNPEVFQVPPSRAKGMRISRVMEIHDAEKAGKPLVLSPEEQEQYREANESAAKMAQLLGSDTASRYGSISKHLSGILESSLARPDFQEQLGRLAIDPKLTRASAVDFKPAPRLSAAETAREVQNSDNIKATATVMNEMLDVLRLQSEAAYGRDQEAKASAAKNFKLAVWTFVAAVAAILVPLLPEIAKGFSDLWLRLGWG